MFEELLAKQAIAQGNISDAEQEADQAELIGDMRPVTGDLNLDTYPADEPEVGPFEAMADYITAMGRAILTIDPPDHVAIIAVRAATSLLPVIRDQRRVNDDIIQVQRDRIKLYEDRVSATTQDGADVLMNATERALR